MQQKIITSNGKQWLFIKVPKNACRFYLSISGMNLCYTFPLSFSYKGCKNGLTNLEIPVGQYEIIGKANKITEEQKEFIVECVDKHFGYYRYYDNDVQDGNKCTIRSANASFNSLVSCLEMKPETTLVLEKIS